MYVGADGEGAAFVCLLEHLNVLQEECGARAGRCGHVNIHDAVKMDRLTPVENPCRFCKQIQYTELQLGL